MTDLKPGFYPGIPYDEYAAWPAINHSRLRRMRTTPMHMRWEMLHEKPPTKALDFGWAVHFAVLEPDKLESQVMSVPKVDKRTTEGKLAWAKAEHLAQGRLLVKEDEMDKLRAIKQSVLAHPTARDLICGPGENEVSIVWRDEDSGVLCKARLDKTVLTRSRSDLRTERPVGAELTVIVDLKTMGEPASLRAFERSAYNFGYFEQAAMYLDGVQAVFPAGDRPYVWVVAETEAPHAVHCFQPDEFGIQVGRKEYKKHLVQYAECEASGAWPGWPDGVDTCSVPPWVEKVFSLEE